MSIETLLDGITNIKGGFSGYRRPELEQQLRQLTPDKRIVFAAAIAERIMPQYRRFCRETGQGNLDFLRHTLNWLWDDILERKLPDQFIEDLRDQCEALIPGDDAIWVEATAYAQDAVGAIYCVLSSRITGDIADTIGAAQFICDTIYDSIMRRVDVDLRKSDWYEIVLNDPVMQQELARQSRDAVQLGQNDITPRIVQRIRRRARLESRTVLLIPARRPKRRSRAGGSSPG